MYKTASKEILYTMSLFEDYKGKSSYLPVTPKLLNINAIQKQKKHHHIFYLASISLGYRYFIEMSGNEGSFNFVCRIEDYL